MNEQMHLEMRMWPDLDVDEQSLMVTAAPKAKADEIYCAILSPKFSFLMHLSH
jgi:hypothetical protein